MIQIRLRAERKAGQLLKEMAVKGERDASGGNRKPWSSDTTMVSKAKLSDLGISKDQSSKFQQLALQEANSWRFLPPRSQRSGNRSRGRGT